MWPKRSFTSFQLATIEVGPQKIPLSRLKMPRAMISRRWTRKAAVRTSAKNLWKKRMVPKPCVILARRIAHGVLLNRIGRPVAARPRNVVKRTAWRYRWLRVKRRKKRSGLAAGAAVGSIVGSGGRAAALGMSSGIFSSRRFGFDLLEAGPDEP